MLPDEPLPELSNEEQDVVSCVLVAVEECKDLEGGVVLGATFCELPEEVTLGAGTTLTDAVLELSFSNLIRLEPREDLLVDTFEMALFLPTTLGGLQGDLVDKSFLATDCEVLGRTETCFVAFPDP